MEPSMEKSTRSVSELRRLRRQSDHSPVWTRSTEDIKNLTLPDSRDKMKVDQFRDDEHLMAYMNYLRSQKHLLEGVVAKLRFENKQFKKGEKKS